jgi:hypothetical protein
LLDKARGTGGAPGTLQSGTPNIGLTPRAGYEIIREIGVEAIRVQSLRLTRLLIERRRRQGSGQRASSGRSASWCRHR